MSRLLRETAPVCLISAPSGAGKTLAVSQWLEADERPSAWLHLDRGDNDPVTLLRYMARALEGVAEVPSAVFSWLQLPQPPVVEAILPALTIAAVTAPPFIFVIDDVQRVREARCWSASWPTLTTLPEGSTVVLCGRADPPLPLARLRAEGRLAEYHFGDLAFDGDEAGELLRLRGLGATPELVESLLETTEGWAAGLYLAVAVLGRQGAPVLPLTPGDRRTGDLGLRRRRGAVGAAGRARRVPRPHVDRRTAVTRPVRRDHRRFGRPRPAAPRRA